MHAFDMDDIELPCPEDDLFFGVGAGSEASTWESSTPPADPPSSPGESAAEQQTQPPARRPRGAGKRQHTEDPPRQQYSVETIDDKRKQRLERNRQSAQDLRKRKREYTSRVELECDKFRAQTVTLEARVSALSAENAVLRQENEFYRGVFAKRSAPPATPRADSDSSGGTTPPRSQRKTGAGALALTFVAVLGLSAYGGPAVGGAPSAIARRAMASEGDDVASLALALPGATTQQAAWFQPNAGDAVGGSVPSLTQALLPYMHTHGESGGGEPGLDWAALGQLGTLQLGTGWFIFLPVADLHDLGWVEAAALSTSDGGHNHKRVDLQSSAASIAVPTVPGTVIEQGVVDQEENAFPVGAMARWLVMHRDELVVPDPASAAAEDSMTSPSDSDRQGKHVHRVLHMLGSMTRLEKKSMLHLLNTDAEGEGEGDEGADETPGQWSAASPALSSLSILLPGGTGEGTEVVEVSCVLLARKWRVPVEADA